MTRNTIEIQLRARLETFATDLAELITQAAAEAVERGLAERPARKRMRRREIIPLPRERVPAAYATSELSFDAYERMAIGRALAENNGDMAAAARALNIGRSTLYRRIQTLGVGDAKLNNDPLATAGVPLSLDAYEKAALLKAIEVGRGDKNAVATALGISKSTFYRKLRTHGVE